MASDLELSLYVFMLAAFVGLEIIRKVSPLLHTPLMSITNAISGISVVGAILVTGAEGATTFGRVLGFIAVTTSVINIVSGFLISFVLKEKYEPDLKGTLAFYRSRFLRIYPLWWAVVAICMIITGQYLSAGHLTLATMLLGATLSTALVANAAAPDPSPAAGAATKHKASPQDFSSPP